MRHTARDQLLQQFLVQKLGRIAEEKQLSEIDSGTAICGGWRRRDATCCNRIDSVLDEPTAHPRGDLTRIELAEFDARAAA